MQTPELLTVSGTYACANPGELLRHVDAGGIVRITDMSRPRVVRAWISADRPAALDRMPDDAPQLDRAARKLRSAAAHKRAEVSMRNIARARAVRSERLRDAGNEHGQEAQNGR
jgi:hypothetical protein